MLHVRIPSSEGGKEKIQADTWCPFEICCTQVSGKVPRKANDVKRKPKVQSHSGGVQRSDVRAGDVCKEQRHNSMTTEWIMGI